MQRRLTHINFDLFRFNEKNKLANAICVYCALNIHGRVSAFYAHSLCLFSADVAVAVLFFFRLCFNLLLLFFSLLLFTVFMCTSLMMQELCSKESEFKAILFSLCYFHACVSERKKFGPLGWSNLSYPFSIGDLTICTVVLYNYLECNRNIPWADLRYLFGKNIT